MSSEDTSKSSSPSPSPSYRTPVLYIEESIKCIRGDDKTRHRVKYDTDWRIYIAYRYGKFVFCGTRQPVPLKYIKKGKLVSTPSIAVETRAWPVVSLSFDCLSEVHAYAKSLFGDSKVNVTLYISETNGTALDDLFAHPSHENFDIFDAERSNRRMELIGYDRVKPSVSGTERKNVVKQMLSNLVYMGYSQTGVHLSFTCSPIPAPESVEAPAMEYNPEQCEGAPYTSNVNDAYYDEEYDYVYSGGTGSYTQTYDYPK